MAIVQKKMNIERSIYEMLQIVSISLTDTTNLKDLFAKPNYNIVNELAKFVLIVKLYNNRPELLPDSNDFIYYLISHFNIQSSQSHPLSSFLLIDLDIDESFKKLLCEFFCLDLINSDVYQIFINFLDLI